MVGVLRETGDGAVPLEPTRGLDPLDPLLARVREAGLDVTLERAGPADPLPSHVDLAAYRVLQEALTNVIRHNGPSRVAVSLARSARLLTLRVANEPGTQHETASVELGSIEPGAFEPGHGITGMRERAEAIGGSLDAGPLPGGGFEVRATFPLDRVNGALR